jgi:hypothetical protein
VQSGGAVRAGAFDLSLAFEFHAELGEERDGGSGGLKVMPIDSVTLSDGRDPGERAPSRLSGRSVSSV